MWGGPDGTPVEAAVADLGRAVRTVYLWDVPGQAFESFMAAGAAFLNSATTVDHGEGMWVEVDRDVIWTPPGPTVAALAVDGSLRLRDAPLVVTFTDVSFDNRCPVDVVYIVAGRRRRTSWRRLTARRSRSRRRCRA